jgi:hypothetical protein
MIIIAHRGNLDGSNPKQENEPFYIDTAINKNFVCEVDVWYINGELFLGHDKPQYIVDSQWITERKNNIIIHQKNIECCLCPALVASNRFTHNTDDYAMTSFNVGWTVRKELLNENTIWVINNKKEYLKNLNLLGICTDYANYYRTLQE